MEILSRDIDAKDVCTLMQLCDSKAEGKLILGIKVNSEFEFQVRQPDLSATFITDQKL